MSSDQSYYFLPASAGKAGIQGSGELVVVVGVVTLLLEQHAKAYKSILKHIKAF